MSSSGELASQDVVIAEFMARNQSGLEDEDGARSDWIEVRNLASTAVDLDGWHLTDDPSLPFKWRFPSRELRDGEALVVFASGKDRAEVTGELHTGFKLAAEGEYLALFRPDGAPAHQYSPSFPAQHGDVSYGIAQEERTLPLIPEGAAATYHVPADASAGLEWTRADFDDASWREGATPVGYAADRGEPGAAGERNLALSGTATQSSTGFGGEAGRGIDGSRDGSYQAGSVTHSGAGDTAPWWEVDLGDSFFLERVVLWNRGDCCTERLTNFRLSVLDASRRVVAESDHFTERSFPRTRDYEIGLPPGTFGRFVRIAKLGPDRNGAYWLSLAEVEVFEGIPGPGALIETDLEDAMAGRNASVYLRFPFQVEAPGELTTLELRVRYDDGFVAYLNGETLASRSAPETPLWNSTATAERPDTQAALFEEIDLSSRQQLLRPGANVLAVHGLNRAADDGDFLFALELLGRSIQGTELGYFPEPTPGEVNSTPVFLGILGETAFSRDHGFYDAPFDVGISTDSAGAVIRYTTDGSAPAPSHGIVYTGPILIETTTTLRAAAFKEGFAPARVHTRTYIFPADVVTQDGAGFPRQWGGSAADYEMDPQVVNHRAYRDTIVRDLQTIPSLSIVMDEGDLFGPQGIYSNPTARGDAWERPCSVELIRPDGSRGFAENAGLRIFGNFSRGFLKKALRLVFRRKYGPARLEYPFFGPQAADRHDTIVLRAQTHRSWHATLMDEAQFIRDSFARDSAHAMGKFEGHATYVHLYLNGLYWGLYNPVERPDASFAAEYFGGSEEDYDAINRRPAEYAGNGTEAIDGDRGAWDAMLEIARRDLSLPENYEALQQYIDLDDLIDLFLLHQYTDNRDGPEEYLHNNMRLTRRREAGAGFISYLWDMEYSIWNAGDFKNVAVAIRGSMTDTLSLVYMNLRANPEFRLRYADRAHLHLLHGGALTPERSAARWMERAGEIHRAVVGESARWGDVQREPPYTRDVEWLREQSRLLTAFFPQRTGVLLRQLEDAGLYPGIEAPEFNRHGGEIEAGFELEITVPAGEVYYTLDGTDPRRPGGEVSAAALRAGNRERRVLLPAGAEARIFVPADDRLGIDWTAPDFDDSGWIAGRTGVGFEKRARYEGLIATDVEDRMLDVNASVYIRVPFTLDDLELDFLTLRVKYDDGYVAYLNGERIASRNAPENPGWDAAASGVHAEAKAIVFEDVDISGAATLLRPGRNVLALHGLNRRANNDDALFLPQLEASTLLDREGEILLERTTRVKARTLVDGEWSALHEASFVTGASGLRVTEIMYNPPPADPEGDFEKDDFEFIELQNLGERAIDLTGLRFTAGIFFDFPPSVDPEHDLGSGETLVVVKNLAAFASRYDTEGLAVAGEYAGNLGNDGERIRLVDLLGRTLLELEYSGEWYPSTDGRGGSLEIIDPHAGPGTWGLRESWRAGPELGSPGRTAFAGPASGGLQRQGDLNQDGMVSLPDAVAILVRLFESSPARPCEETQREDGNLILADVDGDGKVLLGDAAYLLAYLFRDGLPPALGPECVRIPGCPEVCE